MKDMILTVLSSDSKVTGVSGYDIAVGVLVIVFGSALLALALHLFAEPGKPLMRTTLFILLATVAGIIMMHGLFLACLVSPDRKTARNSQTLLSWQ